MSDEKAQKVGRVVFPGLEDVLFIDRERGEERFKKVKEVSTYKPLDEIGFVWEHTVMIDKTAPEDVRKFWEHHAKQWAKEQSMVYVFYKPSCGCEYRMTVLLDRWPMSEKIISHCKECKEGTLLEISDPIEFFIPVLEKTIPLKELLDYKISEGCPQELWLRLYKLEALLLD